MNTSDPNILNAAQFPIDPTGWGTLQWLIGSASHPGLGLTIGRVTFHPGQANPLHFHPNCDEVLHVVEGTIEHRTADGGFTRLEKGDSIVIGRNTKHFARNVGTGVAEAVIIFNAADRQTVMDDPQAGQG